MPLGSADRSDLQVRRRARTRTISGDYRVFVHVLDADGRSDAGTTTTIRQSPTSQWKPGQTVEYTRTRVRAGRPVRRRRDGRGRPLQGQRSAAAAGAGRRRDRDRDRARLQGRRRSSSLPPSENIFVIKKSGWHPAEFARRQPGASSGSGRRRPRSSTFKNPKRDVTFYLEFDARPDVFPDHPQQVTVYSGSQVVETFAADNGGAVLKRIAVSAAQLGDAEHGGDPDRGRPDVRAEQAARRGQGHPGIGHPGLSRIRRGPITRATEARWRSLSPSFWHLP